MAKIAVRLTTERTDEGNKNRTEVYPYNYFNDHIKVSTGGKTKIVITNFKMIEPSRVELGFDRASKTIDIVGDCIIAIPGNRFSFIFILDVFDYDNKDFRVNNKRVAEFEFELI